MESPFEKALTPFQEKLKASSPKEWLSLYDKEIERLELSLREERLGYENAKQREEFIDEVEIANHLDSLTLQIDKLRYERNGLKSGKPVQLPSNPAGSSLGPESIPAKPLFSPVKPLNRKRLTVAQAAEYIGIAKQTLYQWCSEKKIPHKKIGSKTFFDADELDAWTAKRSVKTISEVAKARLVRVSREEAGASKKPL